MTEDLCAEQSLFLSGRGMNVKWSAECFISAMVLSVLFAVECVFVVAARLQDMYCQY